MKFLMGLFLFSSLFSLYSCEEETAGEKMEESMEDTADNIEDGAEDMGDAAEDAVDDM